MDTTYMNVTGSTPTDSRIIIAPGGIAPIVPPIVWGGWMWGPAGWFWGGGPGIRPPMPTWRPPMGRPPVGRPPMGPRPPMINNRPPFGRPPVVNRPPVGRPPMGGGRPPGFRDISSSEPSYPMQLEPKCYFVNSKGETFEV